MRAWIERECCTEHDSNGGRLVSMDDDDHFGPRNIFPSLFDERRERYPGARP